MKGAGTVDLNCGNDSPSLPSSPPTQVNDRKLVTHYSFVEFTRFLFKVFAEQKVK